MPVHNRSLEERAEGLDEYGWFLLMMHQRVGAQPHDFLRAAMTELDGIRADIGTQPQAVEDFQQTELHLHEAVLAWPITDAGEITRQHLVTSVICWRQVAVHLRRLTDHNVMHHDVLGGLRALTSVLTGLHPRSRIGQERVGGETRKRKTLYAWSTSSGDDEPLIKPPSKRLTGDMRKGKERGETGEKTTKIEKERKRKAGKRSGEEKRSVERKVSMVKATQDRGRQRAEERATGQKEKKDEQEGQRKKPRSRYAQGPFASRAAHRRLDALLGQEGKYRRQVPADGHCFFSCVALALQRAI
mmetsp:Transcript_29285/g.59999  ORF Transcript_29285/g.59999 Transcript_29285/m.59999 type:complete len:301 (-) Transcript_29285:1875-2777(-)